MTSLGDGGRRTLLFLLLCVVVLPPVTAGAEERYDENTIIAVLSVNILRFTTWPEDREGGTLELCIMGDDAAYDAFLKLQGKVIGDNSLDIVLLKRPKQVRSCDALYVSDVIRGELFYDAVLYSRGLPIMTMGDLGGDKSKSIMVNFVKKSSKKGHKLEVNLKLVNKARLKLSSRVLKLAKVR